MRIHASILALGTALSVLPLGAGAAAPPATAPTTAEVGTPPGLGKPRLDASGDFTTTTVPLGQGQLSIDGLASAPDVHGLLVISAAQNALVVVDADTGAPRATLRPVFPGAKGRKAGGPTSIAVSGSTAFVASRTTREVCEVDLSALKLRGCTVLPGAPSTITPLPGASELWVMTPELKSVALVEHSKAGALSVQGMLKVEGVPRGAALDATHGVYYVGLSDKDKLTAWDVKTRRALWTQAAGCGKGGARGLAVDAESRILFVGCPDGVTSRNLLAGKPVGAEKACSGLDALGYDAPSRTLFAVSPVDRQALVISSTEQGDLRLRAQLDLTDTLRVVAPASNGAAFVADARADHLTWIRPVK